MGHGETIESRSSFMAAALSIGSTRASDGGFQSAAVKLLTSESSCDQNDYCRLDHLLIRLRILALWVFGRRPSVTYRLACTHAVVDR